MIKKNLLLFILLTCVPSFSHCSTIELKSETDTIETSMQTTQEEIQVLCSRLKKRLREANLEITFSSILHTTNMILIFAGGFLFAIELFFGKPL